MPEQPAPKSPSPQSPKGRPPGDKSQVIMPRPNSAQAAPGSARGGEEPRESAAPPGRERSGVMPAVQLASGTALLHAARLVDVGRSRDHQEDAAGVFVPSDPDLVARKGCLYVVADGMGGHNAGEIASQTALAEIQRVYYSSPEPDTPTALRQAIASANQTILRFSMADSQQMGMGTTAAVAVVRGQDVHVANVGDSRIYLVRGGKAAQITQDHSWVEEQVRAGVLTPDQARTHPQRNIITRALGTSASVEPDLFAGVLQEGDVLVLNSDGLTGHISDAELGEITSTYPPEQAVRRLVDLANERGGSDNISVIVVRAESPATAAMASPAPPAAAAAGAAPAKPADAGERRSRNGMVLIGLLVVVLLVAAVIAFLLLNRPPETPRTKEAQSPSPGAPGVVVSATVGIAALAPVSATVATSAAVALTPGTPPMATATLKPTLAPTPTSLPTPTTRPRSTLTLQGATPTGATQGRTTPGAGTAPMLAPQLAGPEDGVIVTGDQPIAFVWDYNGTLGPNQGFEVRIWRDGASDHLGAGPVLTQSAGGRSQQTIQVSEVPGVRGQEGNYLWTVAVVQASPYEQIGPEASPRRLTYRSAAGPGSSDRATPRPEPTDTPEPQPTDTPEKPPPPPPPR